MLRRIMCFCGVHRWSIDLSRSWIDDDNCVHHVAFRCTSCGAFDKQEIGPDEEIWQPEAITIDAPAGGVAIVPFDRDRAIGEYAVSEFEEIAASQRANYPR